MDLPVEPLPIIMKYDGIFDFDGLYKRCIQFFDEQAYEFHEDTYKGKSDELEIGWSPIKRVTEYIFFAPKVKIHILDMKEIDVVKEGKKVKLTQGRMRIEIDFKIITDYSKRFKGPFGEKLKAFYEKFIIKKDLNVLYHDQIYYHLFKLQTIMKEYMDMETKTNAFYAVW